MQLGGLAPASLEVGTTALADNATDGDALELSELLSGEEAADDAIQDYLDAAAVPAPAGIPESQGGAESGINYQGHVTANGLEDDQSNQLDNLLNG